jgi:hypothetical protein
VQPSGGRGNEEERVVDVRESDLAVDGGKQRRQSAARYSALHVFHEKAHRANGLAKDLAAVTDEEEGAEIGWNAIVAAHGHKEDAVALEALVELEEPLDVLEAAG